MALAVTHVILTLVLLDLFRYYVFNKKTFPRYLVIIGGIAGLLPDIDIPLTWFYDLITSSTINFHGTFTHSILIPIIILVVTLFLQQKEWKKIGYVLAAGWFFHLFLDCLFGGYTTFLWPFTLGNFCPQWGISSHAADIDALILIGWLIHEEVHKKIKRYF